MYCDLRSLFLPFPIECCIIVAFETRQQLLHTPTPKPKFTTHHRDFKIKTGNNYFLVTIDIAAAAAAGGGGKN